MADTAGLLADTVTDVAAAAATALVDVAAAPAVAYESKLAHALGTPLPSTSIFLHPAAVILLVAISSQSLKSLGHEAITALLAPLHTRLFNSKAARTQRDLKRDLFANRQQLNQTSSQDEFAKWAKLRRKVDKNLADLEAVSE